MVTVAYCLGGFVMLLAVFDLFDHMSVFIERRPPPSTLATYYAFLLLPGLEYLAPASLLLSTLFVLWRMTRRNEITAMRAGGIGMLRIMGAFLAVGFLFSVAVAGIKEGVAPTAGRWMLTFHEDDGEEGASEQRNVYFYNSIGRREWKIGSLDTSNPDVLKNVEIVYFRPDRTQSRTVQTERAEWMDEQWWFHKPRVQVYDADENPVGDWKPLLPVQPSIVEMAELDERPEDFANEIVDWEFLSSRAIVRYLRRRPLLSEADKAQKLLYLHQRMAMPWACFIVTLFAIPAGVRGGRRSALAGVFLALACFFAYYALVQIGTLLAMAGHIRPWLGAWLSNIVFLVGGLAMLARIR
mgnify:CR=1 FL=1